MNTTTPTRQAMAMSGLENINEEQITAASAEIGLAEHLRSQADRRGNVQMWGITGVQKEAVLAAALVAIATGRAVPGGGLMPRTALAAAAYAVQVRVERMLRPASTVRRSVTSALLAVALGLVILVPGVLAVLALPPWPRLASPGLAAAGPRNPGPRTRRKGAHAHSRAATDSPIPATATQAPVSVNFRSGTGTPVATHRS